MPSLSKLFGSIQPDGAPAARPPPAPLPPWLFPTPRNAVPSHSRKRGRETVVDPEILYAIAPSSASVEHEILVRDEVAAVLDCLRKFPQREQDIIALKFDAELSNAQIARIMSLSEANVRVILFRTLRKLREMMA